MNACTEPRPLRIESSSLFTSILLQRCANSLLGTSQPPFTSIYPLFSTQTKAMCLATRSVFMSIQLCVCGPHIPQDKRCSLFTARQSARYNSPAGVAGPESVCIPCNKEGHDTDEPTSSLLPAAYLPSAGVFTVPRLPLGPINGRCLLLEGRQATPFSANRPTGRPVRNLDLEPRHLSGLRGIQGPQQWRYVPCLALVHWVAAHSLRLLLRPMSRKPDGPKSLALLQRIGIMYSWGSPLRRGC